MKRRTHRSLAQLRAELDRLRRAVELDPRVVAAVARAKRYVDKIRGRVRAERDHEFQVLQGMISRRERVRR